LQYHRRKETSINPADYKGAYVNKSTGARLKIKSRRGKLVARKGIILRIPLVPFDKDQFYGPANDVLFIFQRDTNNVVINMKANASDFRNFVFEKQ
jgi:hypothetical protein